MSSTRSNTTAILLLLLAGVLAIGAWVALTAGRDSTRADVGVAAADSTPRAEAATPAAITPAETPQAPEPIREVAAEAALGDVVPDAAELGDAIWVEGRVLVPAGTPSDESVELYATGRDFKRAKGHRVRLGGDGAFRVAFAKGTKTGLLKLEARYLYLREPLKLTLADVRGPLELAPELGGVIRGTIELVDASPELRARVPGVYVKAREGRAGRSTLQRGAKVDANLRYELRAMPTDIAVQLDFEPAFLVPCRDVAVALKPGEVTVQDFTADPGATVHARVVDESGRAVAKARIAMHPDYSKSTDLRTSWYTREQTAGDDGTFVIEGVPKAPAQLTCDLVGYEPIELSIDVAKEDVSNLVLTVKRGLSVRGSVRWPDGSPATGARVRWHIGENSNPYDQRAAGGIGVEADARGEFLVQGLGEASYTLLVEGTRKLGDAAQGADKSSAKRKETLKARVTDVRANGAALSITLGSGLSISGTAVDDLGAPLESFSIRARKHSENGWTNEGTARHFKNGAFVLEGLHEAAWKISATAPKHADSEELLVELPGAASGLRLVAPRACRIEGRVLDAAGATVSGAEIRWRRATKDDDDWWRDDRDNHTKTKADGTFVLAQAHPFEGVLEAVSSEGARNEPFELTLSPSQETNGLELRLVGLGEIRGSLDGSVEPRDKRRISLIEARERRRWRYGDAQRSTLSDERGLFAFTRVPEGAWEVVLEPVGNDTAAALDWDEREAQRTRQRVELVSGAVAEVVLGAPDEGAIRVRGRVTSRGRARENARIRAWLHGGETPRAARTNANGEYELKLPSAGEYSITCTTDTRGTQRSRNETFAEKDERVIDFDLPTGALRGRVLGADGAPLPSHWIALEARGDWRSAEGWTSGHVQTDKDGAFGFEDLAAGSYAIDARMWQTDDKHAQQSFGPFEIADGEVRDDIELRLELGGRLEVRVRSRDGTLTSDADVLLRDERDGELSRAWSRNDDAYTLRPRAGRYQVWARGESGASEWRTLEITAGKRTAVELVLECTGELAIDVRDAQGEGVPCRIQAFDERGIDITQHVRDDAGADAPGRATYARIAAGRYVVVASNNDGEIGRKEVTVGANGASSVHIDKR